MRDNVLTLRIDDDLKKRVRVAAAYHDQSMSDWVRECFEEHLKGQLSDSFFDDSACGRTRSASKQSQGRP